MCECWAALKEMLFAKMLGSWESVSMLWFLVIYLPGRARVYSAKSHSFGNRMVLHYGSMLSHHFRQVEHRINTPWWSIFRSFPLV